MSDKPAPYKEKISLYRHGKVVTDLLSIFGSSLRETRLSAVLGYIISKVPEPFIKSFRIRGNLQRVTVEYEESRRRADILIETELEYFIIETKVADEDPVRQILQYAKDLKRKKGIKIKGLGVVPYRPQKKIQKGIRLIGWEDINAILDEILKRKSVGYREKYIIQEMQNHMLKHRLLSKKDYDEIYAREIGNVGTLQLFLRYGMYQCGYEKSENIYSAHYFAPHFTWKVAQEYSGISQGISYIAKIEDIVRAKDRKAYTDEIIKHRGRAWFNKGKGNLLFPYKEWGDEDRNIVFLETPRLVFNPPIKKENLQDGSGWLSRRFFSFDDFFEAIKK